MVPSCEIPVLRPVTKEVPLWRKSITIFSRTSSANSTPCHPGADPETFSCLFCYCPLYALGDRCGGSFRYTANGVKDCTHCLRPHVRENYGKILEKMPEILELAKKKREEACP
ncbi:MAG: cysteine-rich small domain-containing protein [Oscillospiraceae bacterium]